MCGITVCIRPINQGSIDPLDDDPDWRHLVENNVARGPDSQSREDVTISSLPGSDTCVSFVASSLHLRGTTLVPQPHTSDKSIFCWNGEVFEGLDVRYSQVYLARLRLTQDEQIPSESNDGAVLFAALDATEDSENICAIMSKIEGPYAFVFYQRRTHRLFFARDPLGRRSLLIHRPNASNPCFILSSVSGGIRQAYNFQDVDPQHVHCLNLSRLYESQDVMNSFTNAIVLLERMNDRQPSLFGKLAHVERAIPDSPQMISFSGPLPDDLSVAIDRFMDALDTSVRIRVQNIPKSSRTDGEARVAVLYSGGIDSTMIAFLASRHIPLDEPIDLLNVAFENPRKIQSRNQSNQSKPKRKKPHQATSIVDRDEIYKVPDRMTGLEELEELRRLCPGRQWNFVEVDIDYEESSQAKELVEGIMLPNRTVMDMSLALALYFASRGIGKVRKSPGELPEPYTSRARVLLNGLGSDELLGGYGRHRSAFNIGSWEGLIDELQLELDRLPSRNLGRDDRVISSHGKETRHPFLSLSVVEFVASLPVHLKLDPRLELGKGDKMLLRLAARKVGLEVASTRKKRAMQFGSHSARMEAGIGDRDGDKKLSSDV